MVELYRLLSLYPAASERKPGAYLPPLDGSQSACSGTWCVEDNFWLLTITHLEGVPIKKG